MRKGALPVVTIIIGVFVALLIGYSLYPTISDTAKTPTGNTTPYTTTEEGFLDLGSLFMALGIGLLGLMVVFKAYKGS